MSEYPPEKTGLPTRSTTMSTSDAGYQTDEEAVPDAVPSDTIGLLLERLQAWKHACGYLENYVTATEKMEKEQSKAYSRVLKSISDPLKEGHHFDQALGGVAGLFENMRSNTQALANSHLETSKSLDGQVLPILTRLHKEIKGKHSEISSGAGKVAKAVDNAKNNSQKRIESLGQHTAAFDSTGGKIDANNDPYVLHRGIQHMLHKQILEENNSKQDLLTVQQNFGTFEAHVIQTFQQAFQQFLQFTAGRAEREKAMYTDIVGTAQKIAPDFEWNHFQHRSKDMLINPDAPKREISHITYPNQSHSATKPLIAGSLERKSRATGMMTGYKVGFYAVTPAKYLHQFADEDDFRKDPTPDLSLYLPDCTVGAVAGEKFNVKGKDASKGKIGIKLAMSHEISFKAHTHEDAVKWREVIASCAQGTDEAPYTPISPSSTSGSGGMSPLKTEGMGQGAEGEKSAGVGNVVSPTAGGGVASPTAVTSPAQVTSPVGGQTSGIVETTPPPKS